jgi:hypothetical protein
VLVEARLAEEIGPDLQRHAADLDAEGVRVRQHLIAADAAPAAIRALLEREHAAAGGRLVGALLIGRIAAARANKNAIARAAGMVQEQPPDAYWHAHPCDLYYMNLRGTWEDRDGDGVFDAWEGCRRSDLWVSRLRADTVAAALGASEADLLRRYLARNHAYRRGLLRLPRRRALVTWFTIDPLRDQLEHGGWGCMPGLLYGPEVDVRGATGDGAGAAAGYRELMSDAAGYELGVINCVTYYDHHRFGEGGDVRWEWVRDARPKRVLWYHMLTSEPGYHDGEPYLAGMYLFSDAPTVALFCGAQHSGVAAAPTLYPDLAAGCTFGEAYRRAATFEAEHWAEWHRQHTRGSREPDESDSWQWGHGLPAAVLHGDGTLRLPPWQGYAT